MKVAEDVIGPKVAEVQFYYNILRSEMCWNFYKLINSVINKKYAEFRPIFLKMTLLTAKNQSF